MYMKIGFSGLALPEGKVKFNDTKMSALVDKCQPKKVSPYYVEFIKEEFVAADVIVLPEGQILDLLILDMEKCEARIGRSDSDEEKELMKKCIEYMEHEKPLNECDFTASEQEILLQLAPLSQKPVLLVNDSVEVNDIISLALEKAERMFFYTAGPKEVHAWPVNRGVDILTCAGTIHTDLARGFIKGDVAGFDDFMQGHNFNDCKRKGLVKVVDRDHVVEAGDIIEIRFNV